MKQTPISAFEETYGMIYFARMVDKIRKHATGNLREDFVENLGKGFDGRCCDYLRVDYAALTRQTIAGASDEELLAWCYENGRPLNEGDISIWNEFLSKRGINDTTTEVLARRKADAGLAHRDDIQTMLAFFEVDEGRKA